MRKIAHNKTDSVRYSVVQVGPSRRVIGHYTTFDRAIAARGRFLDKPHGSGIGPIVNVYEMHPGEWLETVNNS